MTHRIAVRLAVTAVTLGVTAGLLGVGAAPALAGTRTLVKLSSGIVIEHGGSYTLTLDTDRVATLTRSGSSRGTYRLSRSLMSTIERQLHAVDFAKLHRRYTHVVQPVTGIDPATITYHRHVVTVDPGARAPRALLAVVDTLRGIASKLY